jgi:hypothetical protein
MSALTISSKSSFCIIIIFCILGIVRDETLLCVAFFYLSFHWTLNYRGSCKQAHCHKSRQCYCSTCSCRLHTKCAYINISVEENLINDANMRHNLIVQSVIPIVHTSFHMALYNVTNEIVCSDIELLILCYNIMLFLKRWSWNKRMLHIMMSPPALYPKYKILWVRDDDIDEMAKTDIQMLKQVWADMMEWEKPFTSY